MMRHRTTVRPWMAALVLGLAACGTSDVDQPADPPDLYPLADAAFGEYLEYLMVPGVSSSEEDGVEVFSIDRNRVDGVAQLPLSKTSSAIEELVAADVDTAEQKITDLDGIQYFVNLETLSLTANDIEQLDLTALTELRTLGMNFNLVGELDLSQNALLDQLRYRGSAQAEEGQLLTSIDLSGNPLLTHLYLPNHEIRTIDLSNNPLIDDVLDLSGNPGPDGDPDTPDIVVPDAIFQQVPEDTRLGVISDAGAPVLVSTGASATTLDEAGGTVELSINLNVMAEDDVTVDLVFGGSAVEGEDYTVEATQLVIPMGELTASTTITGVDDEFIEGIETIRAEIGKADNAQLGNARVDISVDDDEFQPDLLLNEILYDPPGDLEGDANGDGTREANEDEFIELVNVSAKSLDLSGWTVWDSLHWDDPKLPPRHTFPAGTVLAPGEVLVVFGGGTAVGTFGGALVQVADPGPLNLTNSGDILRIVDTADVIVLEFDIEPLSNNPDESYTRDPDLVGPFDQPQFIDPELPLYTPGTRNDGSDF